MSNIFRRFEFEIACRYFESRSTRAVDRHVSTLALQINAVAVALIRLHVVVLFFRCFLFLLIVVAVLFFVAIAAASRMRRRYASRRAHFRTGGGRASVVKAVVIAR